MAQNLTTQSPWLNCILDTISACLCFFMVVISEQKLYVVFWTVIGTMLFLTAIRECPIRLLDRSSILSGVAALMMAYLLIGRGLGYYNHELKVMIAVFLCSIAAYFFWDYFSRRHTASEKST